MGQSGQRVAESGLKNTDGNNQAYSLYHTDANNRITRQLMQVYLPLFTSCRRVLDIGCGPGLFLELLREHNTQATFLGMDADPAMVTRARAKGFDARCMRAEDLAMASYPQMDGIYAGHIIEHLAGPTALIFLRACFDLLAPAGVLLIRTPNWEQPYVQRVGFWLDITHVRPYPRELLEKVLTDIGFGIVKGFTEEAGLRDVAVVGVKAPTSAGATVAG
jgi:trans-aconitate methyltransferase